MSLHSFALPLSFRPAMQVSDGHFVSPSAEDLYGLYKLCGDREAVVEHLARSFGVSVPTIRPTVLSWLDSLPRVPPPSRQRSAPPAVEQRNTADCSAAGATGTSPMAPALRAPPPSAPVVRQDLAAAMRALDSRMNHASHAKSAGASAEMTSAFPRCVHTSTQTSFSASSHRSSLQSLPRVPEEVNYMPHGLVPRVPIDDEAASRYLERSGVGVRLAPTQVALKEPLLPSTWMTRPSHGPRPTLPRARETGSLQL